MLAWTAAGRPAANLEATRQTAPDIALPAEKKWENQKISNMIHKEIRKHSQLES